MAIRKLEKLRKHSRKTSGRQSVVVVIPYYNGSKYIDRSARSVLSQTIQPAEFIVVNDGSRPEERDYLHEAAKTYGFRVIDQENGGQGAARNAGVAASTANLICLLDQDDFFLDSHIESLLAALPKDDPQFGWVYGDLFEADGDGNVLFTSMVKSYAEHPKTNAYDLLRRDMFVVPSASMISRKAFDAVGGFDPQFMGYEDDDLFLRIFRRGFTNYFTPRSVTVWCINNESTSYSIRMSRSRLRYFKKVAADFPDDRIKTRFYMRDLLIPRFHGAFAGDLYNAIVCPVPERDEKLKPYLDELLGNFRDYVDVIWPCKSVPYRYKLSAEIQYRIYATKFWPLVASATWGRRVVRKVWTRLKTW